MDNLQKLQATLPTDGIKVLKDVKGDENNINDILLYYGEIIEQHIIFFHGDVQDFQENMLKHRDNHRYIEFSLETTIKILYDKFSNACIWIIRCRRMHLGTFACYEYFLKTNMFGVPEYNWNDRKATSHLLQLFMNGLSRAQLEYDFPKNSLHLPIKIVGFSKGGIVLNQLVYELPLTTQDKHLNKFLKQVQTFIWLDSGNCGISGAYVTEAKPLEILSTSIPHVQIHLTPYQINDNMRPWIRKEKKKFVEYLRKFNCNLKEFHYFEESLRDLEDHFELLRRFIP